MLRILIETPEETRTHDIADLPVDDIVTLRYRPCLYCGKLVRDPRKTCCNSHRTLLSLYTKTQNTPVGDSEERADNINCVDK